MKKHNIFLLALILLTASTLLFTSCGKKDSSTRDESKTVTDLPPVDTSGAVTGDWIIRREMADAEKLNPIVTNDASAEDVYTMIYESLNNMNYETYEMIPWI